MLNNEQHCDFRNVDAFLMTLKINTTDLEIFKNYFKKSSKKVKNIFNQSPLVIDFEGLNIDKKYIYNVYEFLKNENFKPVGVRNIKQKLKDELNEDNILPIFPSSKLKTEKNNNSISVEDKKPKKEDVKSEKKDLNTIKVFDIVRNGQKKHNLNGDLHIYNKVNSGAEIYAAGSLVIIGLAEGNLVAGVKEDARDVSIYVDNFNPTIVSIKGVFKHFEDVPDKLKNKKVLITLKDDRELIFTTLN